MSFVESEERRALRKAVFDFGSQYGADYFTAKARAGEKTTELWSEAGKLGYLGVAVPEEFGGGGGGIGDLAAVCEELAAAGSPLLMMVVSPAICATIIARFGTDAQKQRWLPGFADGSTKMAFAITEPDAGSNSHKLATSIRREGDEWVLNGRKTFISGVDEADAVLVVARHVDTKGQRLLPSLMIVPTAAAGFEWQPIEMDIVSPEKQFTLFLDEVRLPDDALVGRPDGGIGQLFAGLNPERIMAASFSTGIARNALGRAAEYVKTRKVWDVPIGSHQGLSHPLAQCAIQIELARLMTQKAAALYDSGDDQAAGEAANMAKYAGAEAAATTVDQAIQSHGGNGLATEYGLGALLGASRLGRIAPVSREMILNYVSQHTLGLPKSY
ncbi:acyl-CoA dehydrogenase family protein [Kutzneria sp. CA-103260]|uniref:acyl-CoA dehydrogenase family protein n=1 Tax=Kutzneria sp. CA-103260 TaxID=2802641 RepID=UPI001BAD467E|nr:acyl-CoA dehydrogenase [Kutzneria sp. CA-103260]QUQ66851.1 acyl-CoA dehydrogenase [Kutzneria sp. CA-103260]